MIDLKALKREAKSKNTTLERLREIANLHVQISRAVATSHHAPPQILDDLARSSDMPTRAAVAKNPNTPLEGLERLSEDHQWTVLKGLTVNQKTSVAIFLRLALHRQSSVQVAVAISAFVPIRALEYLAQHGCEAAHHAMTASRQVTPGPVLAMLIGQTNKEIRERLALHPNTPTETLWVLLEDQDETVRGAAACNANFSGKDLERLALSSDMRIRAGVAFNRNSPGKVLQDLARDPEDTVRLTVALNHSTPANTLEILAGDTDEGVRQMVAMNPNLSRMAFDRLVEDAKPYVRFGLITSEYASSETRLEIMKSTPEFEQIFKSMSAAMDSNLEDQSNDDR
jgi:hypothetical protein